MSETTLAERVEATQVARTQGSGQTVYDMIEGMRPQIARALPKAIAPDRFLRLVLTECRRNTKLVKCNPHSLMGAVMSAAQLGLEPDVRGLAYLIPRWNKNTRTNDATLLIGYRGYIDLARRSGTITSISAHVVCEFDEFDYAYGIEDRLHHRPNLIGDRGEMVAAYAIAKFKGGGHEFVVLRRDEIDARRSRSQASAQDKGPWVTDYEAMARKTAVRALAPYLPQTVELAQAVALDEQVRTDISDRPLEDVRPDEIPDDDDDEDVPEAEVVDGDEIESPGGPAPLGDGDAPAVSPDAPASAADEVTTAPLGLSEYDAMTPALLRAECATRDLPATGPKAALIERLVAHDERPFTDGE